MSQSIQLDSLRVVNLSDDRSRSLGRRLRLMVLCRKPGNGAMAAVRIPMKLEPEGKGRIHQLEALGVVTEGLSSTWADVEVEPGVYRLTAGWDQPMVVRFRVASDPSDPVLLCLHRKIRASEFQFRLVSDDRNRPLLADQVIRLESCCRVVSPRWRRNNVQALGVYIPLTGSVRLNVGDREWVVNQGEYLVVNPEETAWPSDEQRWPLRLLQIVLYPPAWEPSRGEAPLFTDPDRIGFLPGPRSLKMGMEEIMALWRESRKAPSGLGRLELERIIARLWLVQLVRHHPGRTGTRENVGGELGNRDPRLDEAARLMVATPAHELSLGQVAKKVGVGESWLRRHFQAKFHRSPRDYVQAARVQRAMDLLRNTNQSIEEISRTLGYLNTSGFYKAFKMYAQMSPLALRGAPRISKKPD